MKKLLAFIIILVLSSCEKQVDPEIEKSEVGYVQLEFIQNDNTVESTKILSLQ